jgi:hypothetical protein
MLIKNPSSPLSVPKSFTSKKLTIDEDETPNNAPFKFLNYLSNSDEIHCS